LNNIYSGVLKKKKDSTTGWLLAYENGRKKMANGGITPELKLALIVQDPTLLSLLMGRLHPTAFVNNWDIPSE